MSTMPILCALCACNANIAQTGNIILKENKFKDHLTYIQRKSQNEYDGMFVH